MNRMPLRLCAAAMIFCASATVRGHRLFEEHVLAGFERRDRRLGVLVPHGDDRHRIDLGIGQHVAVVGDRSCCTPNFARQLRSAGPACACTAPRVRDWGRRRWSRSGSRRTSPSPITPMRQPVHRSIPLQKSSSVSSRAMTILPAVSPQSTGSATPVMAAAASEARKAIDAGHLDRLDDAAERIPAHQLVQHLRVPWRALVPDRRAHRAGQHDVGADAVAAIFHAPATWSARSCRPWRRCRPDRRARAGR